MSTVSVDTGRAVWTFADWDGLPEDKDWHGLKDNKCWPKALAPEDPGFALLADDEFYLEQHPDLAIYTPRYEGFPDLKVVQQAILNLDPENEVREVDVAGALKKLGRNGMPLELQGVLPGVPIFSSPKPPKKRGFVLHPSNSTNVRLDRKEEAQAAQDEETAVFDHDELDQWMESYLQLVRRLEHRNGSPPLQPDAVPTPYGQGDATITPAHQGSLATAGLPTATHIGF